MDIAKHFIELCAYASLRPVSAVNEYDLRVFLYDWYPCKVRSTERAARSMLVSIRRFFEFLENHEGIRCRWAWPIIADTLTFTERWKSYPGGSFWDERVQIWRAQNTFDLVTRMLVPVDDLRGGLVWSETMGDVELRLNRESLRLWLAWRDDAVRSGISATPKVFAFVVKRQREWAAAPNANCGGLTPKEAIARERGTMAGH